MKPGIASCLAPNAGTHQEWTTSAAVVRMRIFLPIGTTSSLFHFQQIVLAFRRRGSRSGRARGERRDEADALALALDVVVAPLPLDAGHLDGESGEEVSFCAITVLVTGQAMITRMIAE